MLSTGWGVPYLGLPGITATTSAPRRSSEFFRGLVRFTKAWFEVQGGLARVSFEF